MQVEWNCRPAYTMATVVLDLGEKITIDGGSLAGLSEGIDVHADLTGGAFRSLIRHQFAHETLWTTECTAQVHGAWVMAAPKYPGDVAQIHVTEESPMMLEAGCLLAWSGGVEISTKYAGVANIALHEGATAIKCHGNGDMLVCAFGGIDHFQLAEGQSVIIDTGYLLAWSPSCRMKVGPLQGLVSSQLTKEGLVARITGPGDVYMQTRAQQGLVRWLMPNLGPNARASTRG